MQKTRQTINEWSEWCTGQTNEHANFCCDFRSVVLLRCPFPVELHKDKRVLCKMERANEWCAEHKYTLSWNACYSLIQRSLIPTSSANVTSNKRRENESRRASRSHEKQKRTTRRWDWAPNDHPLSRSLSIRSLSVVIRVCSRSRSHIPSYLSFCYIVYVTHEFSFVVFFLLFCRPAKYMRGYCGFACVRQA